MTFGTSEIYTKNDTKQSWPIGLNVDCEENQIRILLDWSYKCGLRQQRNWASMIDQIAYGLWKKTKHNNDMIDHIGLVYAETKTELSGLIWPSVVCDEN